nr:phosphoribosyltransferase family protein [Marinicella sp. W31]MDC2878872.1 phosphoribosyltransferase family protein [Marinicella sp. W31]
MSEPYQPVVTDQQHAVSVDGFPITLPLVAIRPDLAISLMMVIDLGVRFGEHCGNKLADVLAPLRPDIVVGAATLGIPVAIEVTRALALDRYVILQKSPKVHLGAALEQKITSITSKGEQRLLLDDRAVPLLKGKRVVIVDDVVASGSSLKGSVELVRKAGGNVVGLGVILTEAREWEAVLGNDAALVKGLAHIPQFKLADTGKWVARPETL